MKIRKAKNKDFEQIVSVVRDGLGEFGFNYTPETSELDIENLKTTYLSNEGIFLVCDFNKKIVATGGLLKITNERFKIKKMYVNKKYRGNGIGKQILIQLEKHAIKIGAKILVLETTKLMKTAINLYASFGFNEVTLEITSPRCEISMIKELKKQ